MSEKYKLTALHKFKADINTVFKCVNTIKTVAIIWRDSLKDIEYTTPHNQLGSELTFVYTNEIIVNSIVENLIEEEYYKQIVHFAYKVFPANIQYRMVYNLYFDSVFKRTYLALDTIYDYNDKAIADYNKQKKEETKNLGMKRLNQILDSINFNQCESTVLDTDINTAFEFISDFTNLKRVCSKYIENIEKVDKYFVFETDNLRTLYKMSTQIINKLKLQIYLSSIGEVKDVICFTLIKLGENKCFLSMENFWSESIRQNLYNKTRRDKRRLLKCLKAKFEAK